ncbi:MAG: flagellar hook-associated protein 3 [Myxococcaceae bacterium]|nr:flagellar hook-associated protein 3 [Myxococcaceae bacterium]
MRVSDNATFESIRRQVNSAHQGVLTAQGQASSGLRVAKPSDDPVAAAAARRETSRKALADASKSATDTASTLLQGSDDALNDVYNGLTSVRDLALQGSSSTMSAQDRSAAAIQVRSIREQMVALGNTNVAGRYVFAGFSDKAPAYASDGTFTGDGSTKQVQASPGLRVPASIPGTAIFGTGSTTIFQQLDKLSAALDANDTDAIKASYDALDQNQSRVLDARSQLGSMMNNVTVAGSVAERVSATAQIQVTHLVGMDDVAAATNLMQAKSTLDKAITIAQQIPTSSLAGGK